ncbi:ExeM/NucH family extracellular endonuclease [Nocardioides ferulae]|uniref:ExeM/NucH family extracellular endonuclease n=1 Tax=Nocardioides ferulae TaxID=2340821 RepID=UPI000EABF792|nr:ExeM/NucH family extracellular endonuclease [Nocardioides ferulae]
MPLPPLSARRALAGAAGLALAATGLSLAPITAQANPAGTGLVISEVYGAGGNNGAVYNADFVELYNPSDQQLSLDGLSLQYRSAGGNHGASPFALSGTVAPGSHYLVQMSATGANGVALPDPDATASPTFSMAAAGGQVFLVEGTARTALTGDVAGAEGVVDMVGFTSSSTTFEGAPASAATAAQSANRSAGADTDTNSADFSLAAPNPTPAGEGEDPEDPEEPEEPASLPIAEIQGTGAASPVLGDEVVTEGVVTAAYPSGGLFGFYLQTPGTGGPLDLGTHQASEAVFVYHSRSAGAVSAEPGDHVRVTGVVGEYAGLTQLTVDAASDVVALDTPAEPVQPAVTEWPASDTGKESLEGMLFAPQGRFTVSNTYSTNQYGEVGLAVGDRPLIQPTEVADAQDADAIAAVVADNAARAIVLDDASSTNFLASSYTSCGARPVPCLFNADLTPAYVSQDEPVRVGAAAAFTAPVILSEGGSPTSPTYRFQPTATVVGPENATSPVEFENTRTAAPDRAHLTAEGTPDVTVASFNVLNYFTTVADADDDGVADGTCVAYYDGDDDGVTVRDDCDLRGAWDPQDLARQQEKIVAAINTLDADVVGLMEIENSAALGEEADEATRTLVAALNAAAGHEKWAANPSSDELPAPELTDVITNAIIYQPDSVRRVGEARALGTLSAEGQAFGNAREPIAQTFQSADGNSEPFLVVVNHFKSKGSGVDDGTGQGNANPDRIAQAEALRDWVPTIQEQEGVEATLLVGDFNAYTLEDPLQVLYEAGYTNVDLHSGNGEHSYSFSGLSGSLDHVLANAAAMELYTGADIWNINAGESLALEYSRWNYHGTDFHRADPYRSSDHDPVIVGLDLADTRPASSIEVTAVPKRVFAQLIPVLLRIEVTAESGRATGWVEVTTEDRTYRVPLVRGRTIALLRPFATPGTKTVTVSYAGDEDTQGSETSVTIEVLKRPGR